MANKKKIILAVDDAAANLQIIHSALKGEFDLRLAKSGQMAMMALDRVTPDLILLDLEMPVMSGFDVMDAIRDNPRLKDIPIVVVTAHASEQFVTEAGAKGVRGYIVKPFEPETLRGKVRAALAPGNA